MSVTLTLLIIVRRLLLRHNVLAKQLPIVETLGCVNMLLSDKTGTLTTGVMTLEAVVAIDSSGGVIRQDTHDLVPGSPYATRLLRALALCNGAEVTPEGKVVNGNPTDTG